MPKIEELDEVALMVDVPEKGLKAGDASIVVHVFDRDRGFAVEFSTHNRDFVVLVNLSPASVRRPRSNEIAALRAIEMPDPG